MSWDRPFDQPVPLPNGAPAKTLRDAADYIKKLPKSERDRREWRLAVHMLLDAAEDRGPVLFAKMGMERALNREVEDVFNPDPKSRHSSCTGSGWAPRRKLPSARRIHGRAQA